MADFTEGIIGEEEKAVGVVLTSAIIGPPRKFTLTKQPTKKE